MTLSSNPLGLSVIDALDREICSILALNKNVPCFGSQLIKWVPNKLQRMTLRRQHLLFVNTIWCHLSCYPEQKHMHLTANASVWLDFRWFIIHLWWVHWQLPVCSNPCRACSNRHVAEFCWKVFAAFILFACRTHMQSWNETELLSAKLWKRYICCNICTDVNIEVNVFAKKFLLFANGEWHRVNMICERISPTFA